MSDVVELTPEEEAIYDMSDDEFEVALSEAKSTEAYGESDNSDSQSGDNSDENSNDDTDGSNTDGGDADNNGTNNDKLDEDGNPLLGSDESGKDATDTKNSTDDNTDKDTKTEEEQDKIDEDGKSNFYRVSVVDKDGLESKYEKLSIQGMTLPKPETPDVAKANELAGVSGKIEGKLYLPYQNSSEVEANESIVEIIRDGWNIPNRIPFASELRVEDGAPITSTVLSLSVNNPWTSYLWK